MNDEPERKRVATNWKEYIEDLKNSMQVYKWIWNEFINEEYLKWARKMLIALVASTALNIAQPFLIAFLINGLNQKRVLLIYTGIISASFFYLVQRFCHHYMRVAFEWMSGENIGSAEKEICKRFFEKSISQHLQENSFLSAATVEKGKNRMLDLINIVTSEGMETLLGLALAYIFIWFISPVAGVIMTILIFVFLSFILYLNQKTIEETIPIEKDWRKFNNYRVERLDKVERIKTFGKESDENNRISGMFDKVIKKDRDFWLWFIKVSTGRGLINVAALTMVMSYSAYMIYYKYWGVFSLGMLYPLLNWTSRITDNIWKIGHIEHNLNWRLPSVYSLMEALTLTPDVSDKDESICLSEARDIKVEFCSVSYGYTFGKLETRNGNRGEQQQTVLRNINFTIEPGEKVALIGESGSGKTTIMRLIQRYMDPNSGSIFVNGVDLRDIKLESWKNCFGYVPQQPQIFDGTIRYNLTYGLPNEEIVSDDELWNMMNRLQINFKERLINGLETEVGRHGLKLSGGQAQRVMIGAAALKKPRLMIIDEATSSLDPTTEKAVQIGLEETLGENVGALIITHRLSTVRRICSKFIVLKSNDKIINGDNQIEAIASSFEELYEMSPTFRRLADDQDIKIR